MDLKPKLLRTLKAIDRGARKRVSIAVDLEACVELHLMGLITGRQELTDAGRSFLKTLTDPKE